MADCNYVVPDKDASGDNFYGNLICSQALINYFWNTYGFSGNQDWWDDGFGWEAPCNTNMPLGRTFNGCYVLTYSAADYSDDGYGSRALIPGLRQVEPGQPSVKGARQITHGFVPRLSIIRSNGRPT